MAKDYSVCEVARTRDKTNVKYAVHIAVSGIKAPEIIIDCGGDKTLAKGISDIISKASSISLR